MRLVTLYTRPLPRAGIQDVISIASFRPKLFPVLTITGDKEDPTGSPVAMVLSPAIYDLSKQLITSTVLKLSIQPVFHLPYASLEVLKAWYNPLCYMHLKGRCNSYSVSLAKIAALLSVSLPGR